VNANGTATGQDVLALVQAINSNVTNPLRHDINRNNSVTGQDVLRLVQLLNGQDTSQPWNVVALPRGRRR